MQQSFVCIWEGSVCPLTIFNTVVIGRERERRVRFMCRPYSTDDTFHLWIDADEPLREMTDSFGKQCAYTHSRIGCFQLSSGYDNMNPYWRKLVKKTSVT